MPPTTKVDDAQLAIYREHQKAFGEYDEFLHSDEAFKARIDNLKDQTLWPDERKIIASMFTPTEILYLVDNP